mgnify:CR=1 FL=1
MQLLIWLQMYVTKTEENTKTEEAKTPKKKTKVGRMFEKTKEKINDIFKKKN